MSATTATTDDRALDDHALDDHALDDRVADERDSGPEAPWLAVCRLDDLVPERGAAALVAGDQVALFRLVDGTVLAVQQQDPFTGAHVLSRGIVGTRGDRPTVASPLHKQVFDLATGRCLDPVGGQARHLRTWPVRCVSGIVEVRTWPAPAGAGEEAGA